MNAIIKDIKEADKIIIESIRLKRGKGTYSERMEDMMLQYDNIKLDGLDLVIRHSNGTYKSVWNYV